MKKKIGKYKFSGIGKENVTFTSTGSRNPVGTVWHDTYPKIHTYTVTAEPKYIKFSYDKKPVLMGYFITLTPRNGKKLIIKHQYRSKSTAEFVGKKLINSIIKGE